MAGTVREGRREKMYGLNDRKRQEREGELAGIVLQTAEERMRKGHAKRESRRENVRKPSPREKAEE